MKYVIIILTIFFFGCSSETESNECDCSSIEDKEWYFVLDREKSSCIFIEDFILSDGKIDIFRSGIDGNGNTLDYVEISNVGTYSINENCVFTLESINESNYGEDELNCEFSASFTPIDEVNQPRPITGIGCNEMTIGIFSFVDFRWYFR